MPANSCKHRFYFYNLLPECLPERFLLSEVIVHYFAAIYLFPYDKSVTRFRIVFEGQKCAKLRILALFRCSSHPYFLFKDILHFSPSCCIFAEKFIRL